jgi:hypothetical protein
VRGKDCKEVCVGRGESMGEEGLNGFWKKARDPKMPDFCLFSSLLMIEPNDSNSVDGVITIASIYMFF